MALCTSCGSPIEEGSDICTQCGAAVEAAPAAEVVLEAVPVEDAAEAAVETPAPRKLATGQLVFSIINIVLGCCSCGGFIFGVISLILTIVAKNAQTDEDAAKKLKIAKILNIIGIIVTVVGLILTLGLNGLSFLLTILGLGMDM
ncbi:MAG: hypothetical protein IJY82_00820 [Oscillospiraceae bacterium]|nr:hypothetical protein [Oscillospiraceae bacterium]